MILLRNVSSECAYHDSIICCLDFTISKPGSTGSHRPTLLGVQISVFTGQEKEVLQYKKQRIYTATYFY